MESKPFFVKCLTNGNIIPLTSGNRFYFEKIVPLREDFIFLDEYEQIIGKLEVSPQEAAVYVEAMLEDLEKRNNAMIQREAEIEKREIALAELESKLKKTK